LKNASPSWNQNLEPRASALLEKLQRRNPEAFDAAVDREVKARAAALLKGVEAYRRHPYHRDLPDPPTIMEEGSSRLLDYGGETGGRPVLIVPSLVNRYYILDLSRRNSFLRWLAGEGFRPLVVDWGRPGEAERGFTLTDYIAGRLERFLMKAVDLAGGPLPVVGYCMGGDLALALAARRPKEVAALALLATPWDFHAGQGDFARSAPLLLLPYEPAMALLGELPVDALQALFAGIDPEMTVRKFLAFARLDPGSTKAETFVALEDWLNDGVPLAAPVARETINGWYGQNLTAEGKWLIAGAPVTPAKIETPTLCLIPTGDRIVPPASALALAEALPNATVMQPEAGHIGMMASARAQKTVWEPLATWLAAHAEGA
jgi:polyhydroxyalkanoate synthase